MRGGALSRSKMALVLLRDWVDEPSQRVRCWCLSCRRSTCRCLGNCANVRRARTFLWAESERALERLYHDQLMTRDIFAWKREDVGQVSSCCLKNWGLERYGRILCWSGRLLCTSHHITLALTLTLTLTVFFIHFLFYFLLLRLSPPLLFLCFCYRFSHASLFAELMWRMGD